MNVFTGAPAFHPLKLLLITLSLIACITTPAHAQGGATIDVTLIDSATKAAFAVWKTTPDQLPDQFAPNALLSIKGAKWTVLSADPPAKAAFLQTGKLTLLLAKADDTATPASPAASAPASALSKLFSMPSVSGGIGHVSGPIQPGPNIFSIQEDDWRQVEFVSTDNEKDIDAEFADIHKIIADDNRGAGYSDLQVRERIAEPVHDCTLHDVRELIPQVRKYDAVGFLHETGTVANSFAWAVDDGLVIWGITDGNDNIVQLCLAGAPRRENIPAISAALSKLTLRYDLYLVDWCRETRIHGDIPAFEKYFNAQ